MPSSWEKLEAAADEHARRAKHWRCRAEVALTNLAELKREWADTAAKLRLEISDHLGSLTAVESRCKQLAIEKAEALRLLNSCPHAHTHACTHEDPKAIPNKSPNVDVTHDAQRTHPSDDKRPEHAQMKTLYAIAHVSDDFVRGISDLKLSPSRWSFFSDRELDLLIPKRRPTLPSRTSQAFGNSITAGEVTLREEILNEMERREEL